MDLESPVANLTSIVFHALPLEDQRRFVESLQSKRRRSVPVPVAPDMDEVLVSKPKKPKKPKKTKTVQSTSITANSIIDSYTI